MASGLRPRTSDPPDSPFAHRRGVFNGAFVRVAKVDNGLVRKSLAGALNASSPVLNAMGIDPFMAVLITER